MYERSQLADVLKAQQFKAGDYIIKQGEEGNIFYLLETGTAYATRSVEGIYIYIYIYIRKIRGESDGLQGR